MRRVVRTTNPEGDAIVTEYDARSNPTKVRRVPKPGSTLAETVVTTHYLGGDGVGCTNPKTCNKPDTITDARLAVTRFDWDAGSGHLVRITSAPDQHGAHGQVDFGYTPTSIGADTVQLLTSTTKLIGPGE